MINQKKVSNGSNKEILCDCERKLQDIQQDKVNKLIDWQIHKMQNAKWDYVVKLYSLPFIEKGQ